MLSKPTPGALNLVKHIVHHEGDNNKGRISLSHIALVVWLGVIFYTTMTPVVDIIGCVLCNYFLVINTLHCPYSN